MAQPSANVVTYLITRLNQLGVRHLFAIPGDYTSDFLTIVDEQPQLMTRVPACNELNAGMAAYGYALGKGANGGKSLSALCVTTGVGSSSIINAIAGAFTEKVPIVAIIGTISNTKLVTSITNGEQYHHTIGVQDENHIMFSKITAAFERISNPLMAPAQIDRVLTACISHSMPVVLEIMEDCYYMPCTPPQGSLTPVPPYTDYSILVSMAQNNKYAGQIVNAVTKAVNATIAKLQNSKAPLFWIGVEVARYGLQSKVIQLLSLTNANWSSTMLGKAVIPENTPNFIGVYDGCFESAVTRQIVNASDCFIGIGAWNTDVDQLSTPNIPVILPSIWASRNVVRTAPENYMFVTLENYLDQLIIGLQALKESYIPAAPARYTPVKNTHAADTVLTYDSFFSITNNYLTTGHIVLGDIGLSTLGGSSYLNINVPGGFLCQSIWAHIGWSLPGGLGAGFASGLRPVVIMGDGAFQLSCQELSTMVAVGCPAVVFVLVNNLYSVEQMLDDPEPYKPRSTAPFEAANTLPSWDYISLMKGFSNNSRNAMATVVNTVDDLEKTWNKINAYPQATWLVAVNLPERDYPAAWAPFVANA